jgi:hypothetical protein
MAESSLHAALVERIVKNLTERNPDYLLFVDGCASTGLAIPPSIEMVRPDVFGRDMKTKKAVIGEAKTADDIENPHTELQLLTYFRYLANDGGGMCCLAVPWKGLDKMYFMARKMQRIANASAIAFTVHGWTLPESEHYFTRHG